MDLQLHLGKQFHNLKKLVGKKLFLLNAIPVVNTGLLLEAVSAMLPLPAIEWEGMLL
jgi:fructose-specific component phosphotransferase system IIB-like protein